MAIVLLLAFGCINTAAPEIPEQACLKSISYPDLSTESANAMSAWIGTTEYTTDLPSPFTHLVVSVESSSNTPAELNWEGNNCPDTEYRFPFAGQVSGPSLQAAPCAGTATGEGNIWCEGSVTLDDFEAYAELVTISGAAPPTSFYPSVPFHYESDGDGSVIDLVLFLNTDAGLVHLAGNSVR